MAKRVKFVLPDWDDIVDPNYDFEANRSSEAYKKDKYIFGARLWELVGNVVDGVLISLSTLTENKLYRIKQLGNVRNFMRIPNSIEVIGDSGAWQYRYLDTPPITVHRALELYEELGVDLGVTVDHIALFGNFRERMEITYRNAIEMLDIWKKGRYSFKLMGAVQGLEVKDYLKGLERLYNAGYRTFAIGGLAKRDTRFIDRLINELIKLTHYLNIERIHFLGITRLSVISKLWELSDYVGEISFDSSTPLRIAWTREFGNYLTEDGKAYTAIRVNDAEVITMIRLYDRGEVTFEVLLDYLKKYLIKTGQIQYLPYYIALLKDRPWKKCTCNICKTVGVDVVIFKGNNRNRRRGFHNVYVFSKLMNRINKFKIQKADTIIDNYIKQYNENIREKIIRSKKILILTNCTSSKNIDERRLRKILADNSLSMPSFDLEQEQRYRAILEKDFAKPASLMYGGSFTAIRNLANALRDLKKEVDVYIISARYGLIHENETIIPYDASLKGLKKTWIVAWSQKMKIEEKLTSILDKFDLIIVVLPKEYAFAIESTLKKLLYDERAILIIPKIVNANDDMKATIIFAGNLKARLKRLKEITELVSYLRQTTLDVYLNMDGSSSSYA